MKVDIKLKRGFSSIAGGKIQTLLIIKHDDNQIWINLNDTQKGLLEKIGVEYV